MKKEDLYKKISFGNIIRVPSCGLSFLCIREKQLSPNLPVLSEGVNEIQDFEYLSDTNVSLKDHITIMGYWGGSLKNKQAEALNSERKNIQALL